MHPRYNFNHIIAIAMIVFYLILPALNPAHAISHASSSKTLQPEITNISPSPHSCPDCPDSDHHHTDCCEINCSCACQASSSGVRFIYSPMVTTLKFPDPYWSLPQVYRRIFVPPQNA